MENDIKIDINISTGTEPVFSDFKALFKNCVFEWFTP